MKIILVLNLVFLALAHAYKPKDISLSDFEFRRYVRPQLKSITNEFQTLMFALNPDLSDYKSVYSNFKDLSARNQKIRKDCAFSSLGQSCSEELRKIEKILSTALSSLDSADKLIAGDTETKLAFQHSRQLLSQKAFQALLKTQSMLFYSRLTGNFGLDVTAYSNQLNYLYDQFHTFLFKSSDPQFRNEFSSFWINFIRPVETFVLHQNSRDFFISRLTELNMRWHMLNVRLTKRGYTPSKQASTLLNIMHRRWTNILKVTLNPKG